MDDLIDAFEVQGGYCEKAGAQTYAYLCRQVAADIAAGGVTSGLLAPWSGSPKDDAIALRLMGGLHRLALDGRAPELARHFKTCGGDGGIAPTWPAVQKLLINETEALRVYLSLPPQTNEVMRSAALLPGFLVIAERTGLPLRCLELGASGGLNQVWDLHHYDYGAFSWGDPAAPLKLQSTWTGAAPPLPDALQVSRRAACDLNPIYLSTDDGCQLLRSYVWPDQPDRMTRLTMAIDVARQNKVTVTQADAGAWIEQMLADQAENEATVIYHSIAWQYFPQRTQNCINSAIRSAMTKAPVFWLTMEIEARTAGALPKLTLISSENPEGEVLAEVHFHGGFVNWAG